MSSTLTLFRPVGPAGLALIKASGWREFPPRLPEFNRHIVGTIEVIRTFPEPQA